VAGTGRELADRNGRATSTLDAEEPAFSTLDAEEPASSTLDAEEPASTAWGWHGDYRHLREAPPSWQH
jgi:hypothetical protein